MVLVVVRTAKGLGLSFISQRCLQVAFKLAVATGCLSSHQLTTVQLCRLGFYVIWAILGAQIQLKVYFVLHYTTEVNSVHM